MVNVIKSKVMRCFRDGGLGGADIVERWSIGTGCKVLVLVCCC